MGAIAVERLEKTYPKGVRALDGVSFSVREGEIFGLLGSNGAGKTTAVETIQGLRRRDAGTISLLGLDPVADADEIRRRHLVGAQLQTSALPDRLKVGEALRLFATLADDAVDWSQLSERWGLRELERRPFAALSGGQRQRLFLALALVSRPRLVFLDELTQGLDAAARRQTWELIAELREAGTTVVLVTHYMDEAERCDRIAIIDQGRIVAIDTPSRLKASVGADAVTISTADDAAARDQIAGGLGVEGELRPEGVRLLVPDGEAFVPRIFEHVTVGIGNVNVRRPSLDDVFINYTGHAIRDAEAGSVDQFKMNPMIRGWRRG